jgi:NitT/TauT family transport system substrate-binding protein
MQLSPTTPSTFSRQHQRIRAMVLRCVVALCLSPILLPSPARAETLRLVVGGLDKQIYLPVVIAQRLGYFAEQGLDVQLQDDSSGVRAEDKLLAGAVQGVVGFYDHTIVLQAKGKFVRAVVQFSRAPGEALLGNARLRDLVSPAGFGGRTLGVAGLGSSTHLLTQYFALAQGVKASEMNFVALESGPAFVDAMSRGRIDAGMTTEPVVSQLLAARQAGLLVDLRTPAAATAALGGPYPGACLYLSSLWIETHRADAQKLVNALVKALRYVDAHRAEEIAAQLPPATFLGDRDAWVAALAASKAMFIADGVMPPDGPATVLKVLKVSSRAVHGKAIDLARTYTTEFVTAAR